MARKKQPDEPVYSNDVAIEVRDVIDGFGGLEEALSVCVALDLPPEVENTVSFARERFTQHLLETYGKAALEKAGFVVTKGGQVYEP